MLPNQDCWYVDEDRILYDTKEVNKKGKPVKKMKRIRKLYVIDRAPITDSGQYRITITRRQGVTSYTVSAVPVQRGSIFDNPSGKVEPWHTLLKGEWQRIDSLPDYERLRLWLQARIGASHAIQAATSLVYGD